MGDGAAPLDATPVDAAKYADLFRTESREQLATVNRALLQLEQGDETRAPVDEIFRGVHTIKGMSATMGYTALAEFSHELESLLDKMREGAQSVTAELMDALFEAADALELGLERPDEGGAMPEAMRRALERLHDVAGGRSTAEFQVPHPMRRASDVLDDAVAEPPATRRDAPRARHVRIELARLDRLLDLIGELVIVRGRLEAVADALRQPVLDDVMREATRLIGDLQSEIMTSRLVPVGQVFDRFPRLVRDVARQLGKDVLFAIEGKGIEIDRSVLDEIGEPVVHLLRNAVDHGLETPDEREAAGKPRAGRLVLSAQRERNAVVLTVRDDGRGIDRAKVLLRARAAGLVPPETATLDDDALLRCIAHPGLSTAERISEVSGRGVGVDAVLSRTRALGGSVALDSTPGVGTALTLRLPVTLAIVRAVLARVGDERYALPLTHVRETLERTPASVRRAAGGDVLVLRDEELPLLRLRDVVQLPAGTAAAHEEEVVVIARGDRRAGLVVDELTGQEDIVVKRFDDVRGGATLFSGATILADGVPALIVDVGSLL